MLEIIAQSFTDCLRADIAGVDRIELVSALSEGGLTPSLGMTSLIHEQVITPVYAMIRPHSRSFHYELSDLEVMKRDAQALAPYCDGFVLGILDAEGLPDVATMESVLAETSQPVTFHRAFDEVSDVALALRRLNDWPRCERILTSGGPGKVFDHLREVKALLNLKGRLTVQLGSGINLENLAALMEQFPQCDFHLGTALRGGSPIAEIVPELLHEAERIYQQHQKKEN
ncbi:Cytoplasmic copper homeostasis protein cutC [Clostridiaceae bacterium JG1575]|nr:Cytoplasmic copper homeostasis protein cutC [Clostridiaceae bacterium JG1575]